MTASKTIRLQALLGSGEAAAASRAADLLTSAVGEGLNVCVAFPASFEAIDRGADPCIVLTSMLDAANDLTEPWPACEGRLRGRYVALTRDPKVNVFVLTILRRVWTEDGAIDASRLNRIRRLNLLAAELSRETGLYVIDIDRALADIGAGVLGADHRLEATLAVEAAGRCIAGVVLAASLEGAVAFDRSQAAAEMLAALPIIVADGATPSAMPVVAGAAPRRYARPLPNRSVGGAEGRLVDLLEGRASVGEAFFALRRAIARRGLAKSVALILGALPRLAGRRARVAR